MSYYITTSNGTQVDIANIFDNNHGNPNDTNFTSWFKVNNNPSSTYTFNTLTTNETFSQVSNLNIPPYSKLVPYTTPTISDFTTIYRGAYSVYATPGSYSIPPPVGCTNMNIIAIGGGGAGSNSGVSGFGDGVCGGGGGCVIFNYRFTNATTLSNQSTTNTVQLYVGQGGNAGSDQSNGSYFYNSNSTYFSGTNSPYNVYSSGSTAGWGMNGYTTSIGINNYSIADAGGGGGGGSANSGTAGAAGTYTISSGAVGNGTITQITGLELGYNGNVGSYSYGGTSGYDASQFSTTSVFGSAYYQAFNVDTSYITPNPSVNNNLSNNYLYTTYSGPQILMLLHGSSISSYNASGGIPTTYSTNDNINYYINTYYGSGGIAGRRWGSTALPIGYFSIGDSEYAPGSAGAPGVVVIFYRYD